MKFSKMWKLCVATAAVAGLSGLCACEWGAGHDADSWSDSFNWVNFSGEYRGSGTKTVTKTNVKESGGTTTASESTSSALTGSAYMVVQSGQNLTITDKSGAIFKGKFSSMRSASGYENRQAVTTQGSKDGVKTYDGHALPPGGDTIIGSFEATGPAGRMVGTFQGTVYDTDTNGTGDVFGNRTMTATLVGPTKTTQIEASSVVNTGITIFYPSGGTNGVAPTADDSGSSSSGS